MGHRPEPLLREHLHDVLSRLMEEEPLATQSEAYLQHRVETELLHWAIAPPYTIRIGINYHGQWVQHMTLDNGVIVGWNPGGDVFSSRANAKMRMKGYSIFARRPNEQLMTDSRIGGGPVAMDEFVRTEFKVRGWLGKTRNLDGAQLLKDVNLLRDDLADLLVVTLSERAYLQWRGGGPAHQAVRRTGVVTFRAFLPPPPAHGAITSATGTWPAEIDRVAFTFESSTQRVTAAAASTMPGAVHFVTLVWAA